MGVEVTITFLKGSCHELHRMNEIIDRNMSCHIGMLTFTSRETEYITKGPEPVRKRWIDRRSNLETFAQFCSHESRWPTINTNGTGCETYIMYPTRIATVDVDNDVGMMS